MFRLDLDSKRYYQNGWRPLGNANLAHMRLDQITTTDAEVLGCSGGAATANCAFRTLWRMLPQAREWNLLASTLKIKTRAEYGRSSLTEADTEQELLAKAKQLLYDVLLIIQDAGIACGNNQHAQRRERLMARFQKMELEANV